MEGKYKGLPGIFLDMNITGDMVENLSDCEIGNIIKCLYKAVNGENCFQVTQVEKIYFQLLSKTAKQKADKWLNQTSNFRNNNPNKKKS